MSDQLIRLTDNRRTTSCRLVRVSVRPCVRVCVTDIHNHVSPGQTTNLVNFYSWITFYTVISFFMCVSVIQNGRLPFQNGRQSAKLVAKTWKFGVLFASNKFHHILFINHILYHNTILHVLVSHSKWPPFQNGRQIGGQNMKIWCPFSQQ